MIENGSLSSFNETKSFGFLDQAKHPERAMWLLVILAAFSCVILLGSNVIAGKVLKLSLGPIVMTFPGASLLVIWSNLTFDSLSNIYGTKAVKKVTWMSIIVNVFMQLVFATCVLWPAADFFTASDAYKTVLATSLRVTIGSLVALYFSQLVNSLVLQKIKKRQIAKNLSTTDKKGIFIRSWGSSLVGTAVDACLFVTISFFGTMPITSLIVTIVSQYIIKCVSEADLQGFCSSLVVGKLVDWTGLDVVDA